MPLFSEQKLGAIRSTNSSVQCQMFLSHFQRGEGKEVERQLTVLVKCLLPATFAIERDQNSDCRIYLSSGLL